MRRVLILRLTIEADSERHAARKVAAMLRWLSRVWGVTCLGHWWE